MPETFTINERCYDRVVEAVLFHLMSENSDGKKYTSDWKELFGVTETKFPLSVEVSLKIGKTEVSLKNFVEWYEKNMMTQ